jgi:hypothetical protein
VGREEAIGMFCARHVSVKIGWAVEENSSERKSEEKSEMAKKKSNVLEMPTICYVGIVGTLLAKLFSSFLRWVHVFSIVLRKFLKVNGLDGKE